MKKDKFNPKIRIYVLLTLVFLVFSILVILNEQNIMQNKITGNPIIIDGLDGDSVTVDTSRDSSDEGDTTSASSSSSGSSTSMTFMRFPEAKIPQDAIGVYTIFPSFMVEIDYNIKEYNEVIKDAKLFLEEVEECKKEIIPPDHENYSLDQDEPESIDECVQRKKPLGWIPISSEGLNYNYDVYVKETINGIPVKYRLALYFGKKDYELDEVEFPSLEFVKPTPIYSYSLPGTGDTFGEKDIITSDSVLFNYGSGQDSNLIIALSAISHEFNQRGIKLTPRLLSAMTVTMIKEVGAFGYLSVEESGDNCYNNPNYGGGCDYKGRGYIQITGKGNYEKYCGDDCIATKKDECNCNNVNYCQNKNCPPAKALQPEYAARIFAEYYIGRNLVSFANQGQYYDVGWRINGAPSYGHDFDAKAKKLEDILKSNSAKTAGLLAYLNP